MVVWGWWCRDGDVGVVVSGWFCRDGFVGMVVVDIEKVALAERLLYMLKAIYIKYLPVQMSPLLL